MRHFFAARPVAALSCRMAAPPRWAILVALSGTLDAAAPGVPGTVFGNKSGRGRSSRRTETAALMQRRHDRNRDRHVDDRHDCRDTVPACVPSTV
jgi:hypothetical protein